MNSTFSSLNPSTFIASVAREVSTHYAHSGKPIRSHVRSRLAQFWWGADGSVHYELWVHERTVQLELGLHFESTPARNRALYVAFSRHLLEIHQRIGDTIWLEEWDKGWTRLYETQPLYPLDEARIYSITARLCEIIDCLQPIYESVHP
jgi:hypothetical protein